jgi:hypothetical protein
MNFITEKNFTLRRLMKNVKTWVLCNLIFVKMIRFSSSLFFSRKRLEDQVLPIKYDFIAYRFWSSNGLKNKLKNCIF